MTVQSIDKRTAADTTAISAVQGRQEAIQSGGDIFLTLLREASQRYGGQGTAVTSSVPSILVDQVGRARAEAREDAASSRDAAPSDRPQGGRDTRSTRTDRADRADRTSSASRPDRAAAADRDEPPPSRAAAGDQDVAVPESDPPPPSEDAAAAPAEDDTVAVAPPVETDGAAPVVAGPVEVVMAAPVTDAKGTPVAAETGAAKPQDVLDGQAGPTVPNRPSPQDASRAPVAVPADAAIADTAASLVPSATGSATAHAEAGGHREAARLQAEDLASRLADPDTAVEIAVQVTRAPVSVEARSPAAAVTEAMTRLDPLPSQVAGGTLAQEGVGGQGAGTGSQPQTTGQPQTQAQGQAAQIGSVLVEAEGAAQTPGEAGPAFAAILAAQSEAQAPVESAPQSRPVASLTGLTGAQGADRTASTQTAQAVRVPRTPMPSQVLDQISVQIDKAVKDGADTVKIQLKPADLGRIEIKLDVGSDGRVSATVTADKPETLAMLQKDARGLEKALQDAGLKPDSSATSFNLRGGEQQQQQAERNGGQGGRRGRGREGGGAALSEVLSAAPTAASGGRAAGGRAGVDISV